MNVIDFEVSAPDAGEEPARRSDFPCPLEI
jgi:hypothetical protein